MSPERRPGKHPGGPNLLPGPALVLCSASSRHELGPHFQYQFGALGQLSDCVKVRMTASFAPVLGMKMECRQMPSVKLTPFCAPWSCQVVLAMAPQAIRGGSYSRVQNRWISANRRARLLTQYSPFFFCSSLLRQAFGSGFGTFRDPQSRAAWMLTLPKLRKLLAMSKARLRLLDSGTPGLDPRHGQDKSWKDWLEFMQDSKRQLCPYSAIGWVCSGWFPQVSIPRSAASSARHSGLPLPQKPSDTSRL